MDSATNDKMSIEAREDSNRAQSSNRSGRDCHSATAGTGTRRSLAGLYSCLHHPIRSRPLRVIARASSTAGSVASDIARHVPARLLLSAILTALQHVPDRQIRIFVATGTHRENTPRELRDLLGSNALARFCVNQNSAADESSHIHVGTSRFGNDIRLLREFLESDVKVVTGWIEPHLFAGFSGGAKGIMPGLAALATIARNHCPTNIDHPDARWGVREGNPIWEEIDKVGQMVGPIFLLNVTMDHKRRITGVFAGDLREAHAHGCEHARTSNNVRMPGLFEVVIAGSGGYPQNINLYQVVKGMSADSEVTREGGSILMAAECVDGVPSDGGYCRILDETRSASELLDAVRRPGGLRKGAWQAHIQALVCRRTTVYMYSKGLSDAEIARAHLRPAESISKKAQELIESYGPSARICSMPLGPLVVPHIQTSESW
jgi:nickel-dependent lactate racemase